MHIDNAEEFVSYWRGFRERTWRAIERITPGAIEWTPPGGNWSMGDIVRHLAGIERDMYAENVMGRPSRYPGHGRDLADGVDAVREYHRRKHGEALEMFASLTPAQLQAKCTTPAGTPITTWKWMRAMVEHEAHHRGQLYLMLRLCGVQLQPLYGLTEEEVHARSAR
jgi:uncharacterized damage-inducible protein DinB